MVWDCGTGSHHLREDGSDQCAQQQHENVNRHARAPLTSGPSAPRHCCHGTAASLAGQLNSSMAFHPCCTRPDCRSYGSCDVSHSSVLQSTEPAEEGLGHGGECSCSMQGFPSIQRLHASQLAQAAGTTSPLLQQPASSNLQLQMRGQVQVECRRLRQTSVRGRSALGLGPVMPSLSLSSQPFLAHVEAGQEEAQVQVPLRWQQREEGAAGREAPGDWSGRARQRQRRAASSPAVAAQTSTQAASPPLMASRPATLTAGCGRKGSRRGPCCR